MEDHINIFLFIFGLILFFYKPKYVPLYTLAWPTLIIYFISLISPVSYQIYNSAYPYSENYVWLCFALSLPFSFSAMSKNEKILVSIVGFFLLYIFVLGYFRGGLQSFQGWVRGYTCFVPLWLLIKYNNISFSTFQKFVIVVFSFELILGLIQYTLGYAYPGFSNGRFAENGTVNITGTFGRYNAYADSVSLLILSLIFIKNRVKIKKIINIFLMFSLVIGSILVALSGARTELIGLISAIAILCFYKVGKSVKGVLSGVVIFSLVMLLLDPIQNIITRGASSEKTNYGRLAYLEDFFSGKVSMSEQSTLFLTDYLIREYASEPSKMITGPGKLFSTSGGYGELITTRQLMWDSFITLYLCETGIIGIIFLVLFLYLILKNSNHSIYAILLLVYLLINTVTEYGLFRGASAIYFLFIVFYEQRMTRKNKLQGLLINGRMNKIWKIIEHD